MRIYDDDDGADEKYIYYIILGHKYANYNNYRRRTLKVI